MKSLANEVAKLGQTVLVLQGGGALGAYQVGVYEALHEAGVTPDWVIGTSIGAINASLIAGNVAKLRVERLARILAPRFIGRANACPCMHGSGAPRVQSSQRDRDVRRSRSFFKPRIPPPYFAPDGRPEADHGTILLTQPFFRGTARARAVRGRRSTQVIRRGVPHRTQVDARYGVVAIVRLSALFTRFRHRDL